MTLTTALGIACLVMFFNPHVSPPLAFACGCMGLLILMG